MVRRDGSTPEPLEVDRDSAAQLLSQASAAAVEVGIGWELTETSLTPAPKLIELLRRSREVSAREPVESD